MHTRCSNCTYTQTRRLLSHLPSRKAGRHSCLFTLKNKSTSFGLSLNKAYSCTSNISAKTWPLHFIAIFKKKVVKNLFFVCSWTHQTSRFSSTDEYLFGWGRVKASSADAGTEAISPVIATCLYTQCHSGAGGAGNVLSLLVYKAGTREACHTWAWLQSLWSFSFSLKLDGLQPLYILRKTQNVPQTMSTASR